MVPARYYVQGDELWLINAPGANGEDAPVMGEWVDPGSWRDERHNRVYRDTVAAMRAAGLCEPVDRVAT